MKGRGGLREGEGRGGGEKERIFTSRITVTTIVTIIVTTIVKIIVTIIVKLIVTIIGRITTATFMITNRDNKNNDELNYFMTNNKQGYFGLS